MLAIVNARVWTGDPRRPWADAVLVSGDRVVLVGTSAEVKKRAGSALVVDARGRMLIPAATQTDVGVLVAGAPADLVIIEREIAPVTPDTIRAAAAVLTMSSGQIVYDRDGLTH
jgi:predicted amidohydrolase YtcJ